MQNDPDEEAPPILGRWRNIYLLLLLELSVLIAVFYAFSRWASS